MTGYQPQAIETWCAALAPDVAWQDAYEFAHAEVIGWLKLQPAEAVFSTKSVVDVVFPIGAIKDAVAIAARKRLMRAILVEPPQPVELDSYRTRGPGETKYIYHRKVTVHPWSWHNARNNVARDPDAALLGE